jgi:uncharacterized protein YciI
MFVVTLTYLRPLAELDALMPKHVAWLRKHYRSGLFLASGRQVPRRGGVILARSGKREELERLLLQDPFVQEGCARVEVMEFKPSKTAVGAEALKAL